MFLWENTKQTLWHGNSDMIYGLHSEIVHNKLYIFLWRMEREVCAGEQISAWGTDKRSWVRGGGTQWIEAGQSVSDQGWCLVAL